MTSNEATCKHEWVRWEKVVNWVGHGITTIKNDTAYVDFDDEMNIDYVDTLDEEYECRNCNQKLENPPSNWEGSY